MTEPLQQIFVDFNRRAAEPDTYVTWANQFPGPIPLGAPVHLSDLEELEFDGYITGVSANGRDVFVRIGDPPARTSQERHLAVRTYAEAWGELAAPPAVEIVSSASSA